MSHKNPTQEKFFPEFAKEIKHIFKDIIFVYRHFFHWFVSKICISVWSVVLGVIITLPLLTLALGVGLLDPINWLMSLSGANPGNDILVESLATNPFWLITMIFLLATAALLFLLASSYSLLLFARLSYKYTERKLLDYKKNLYFSRKHISTFMGILSWNFVYLMAPITIWCGGVFFLYLFYHSGTLSFTMLSYSLMIISIIAVGVIAYMMYRILFGYIILAHEKDPSEIKRAKSYLHASCAITAGRNFWKFLFIAILYSLVLSPFRMTEDYLTETNAMMRDALAYKTKLIENIDAEDMPYYEYITKEYENYGNDELIEKIILFSRLRILYFFLSYFLFGGLFILIISSFYARVLDKK